MSKVTRESRISSLGRVAGSVIVAERASSSYQRRFRLARGGGGPGDGLTRAATATAAKPLTEMECGLQLAHRLTATGEKLAGGGRTEDKMARDMR